MNRRSIDIDSHDLGVLEALREDKGDDATSCAYVKDGGWRFVGTGQCGQKDRVGTHLHGGALVGNGELFEGKHLWYCRLKFGNGDVRELVKVYLILIWMVYQSVLFVKRGNRCYKKKLLDKRCTAAFLL